MKSLYQKYAAVRWVTSILAFILILAPFAVLGILSLIATEQGKAVKALSESIATIHQNNSMRDEILLRMSDVMGRMIEYDSIQQSNADAPTRLFVTKELSKIHDEVVGMKRDLDKDSLYHRIGSIEGVILTNPEKALSVPMLRSEIESVDKRLDRLESEVSNRLDSITGNTMNWMTLLITFLAGITGTLVTIRSGVTPIQIVRRKRKGNNDASPKEDD